MRKKIFCDLDGVLADFIGGACKLHGINLDPYPVGVWDFVAHIGMDPKVFWAPLGYNFWGSLDPTPEFDQLTGRLAELDAEVYLLSSPCDTHGCRDGKQDWVADHWPAMKDRLILTRAKEALAGPGRVLIDDSDYNCKAWLANGGQTVLFPRPWNALHHLSVIGIHHVLNHPFLAHHERAHTHTTHGAHHAAE